MSHWSYESRRGEVDSFSRKSNSITERKFAQEFLFDPPRSNEHDDRIKKVYSPVEKVFGDSFVDNVSYRTKKSERVDWKKFDSDGTNDLYGGDWTKEMGINRKVFLVDSDKRSNLVGNKSICEEQALLEEFDHVEKVLSRTVSYKNQEMHRRSSKAENIRSQAYISHASSEKDIDTSDDALLPPPPPPPPDISLNLEEVEMQIEKLDREFEKIIVNGAKSSVSVDLDLIEAKSEERRKLKNTIKQIKKQMRSGYQNVKWQAVRSIDVYRKIKEQDCMKPSFMIEGKFKDLDQAKEYFGKYGTLSKVEQVYSKVKLEYYNRQDALNALEAKHSKNILFFLDPHPELISKYRRHTKSEDTDDYTKHVIDSYFSQRSRHSPSNLREDNFDDVNSCIQSQQVLEWPKREERYPKIKKECKKYSVTDFKPNKQDKFSITITNHRHLFNTEEELYDYFVSFGDISSVAYTDGSEIGDRLNPRKEIRVDYEVGHSLLLAVNSQHNDISVKISDDCKVDRENPSPSRTRDCDSNSRKRKKSRDLSVHPIDMIGPSKISPKHKKFEHFSDKENDKNYDFDLADANSKFSPRKRMSKSEDPKRGFKPQGHSKHAKWECLDCGGINNAYNYFRCYKCNSGRPGNWDCEACGEVNLPDKLYCYQRHCKEIRKGNWVCPDQGCQNVNWSRSLYCYEEGCHEVQPGAWNCKDCTKLNFKSNNNCHFCKNNNGLRARKRYSSHETRNFAKQAELEKHRQAFEKISQDENRNLLGKTFERPEFVPNPRLHSPEKEESSRDWSKDFSRLKHAKDKKIEESRKKAQIVQSKLLAIAGDYQPGATKDPQPGPSGFGKGKKSKSFGFGGGIATLEEVVDIADSDEEPEHPIYKNANMVPIAPRRSKICNTQPEEPVCTTEPKDPFDDALMEKLKNGKLSEQAEILKKYNIIPIESPPNSNKRGPIRPTPPTKVVEVDLASDSEDEAGRYSDGSSIHIDDDMEVDQDIVTDSDPVGTVPRKNMNNSFGNLNHLKTSKDQELINQIVNKDLEKINLNRKHLEQEESALTANFDEGTCDDDIVILSDEDSVK